MVCRQYHSEEGCSARMPPPNVGMTTMHLLGASSCHRQWYGQKLLTTIVRKIEGRVVRQVSNNGRPKYHRSMVQFYIFCRQPQVQTTAVYDGQGLAIWHGICISLVSRMVSWYKNEIVRAGVSNRMCQCLIFLVLNVHIPVYLGSRGKPFFQNFEVFLVCLPIVDQYKFVYTNL